MTTNTHENFEEIEIQHNLTTYYATGYIEYATTQCIGTNYEGFAFEILYKREIYNISISELWYYNHESGDGVDILGKKEYGEIEKLAEEVVRYRFE